MATSRLLSKFARLGLFVSLLCFSIAVHAGVSTWTLSGVTFTDGGTAVGSFDYDPDTNTLSNWEITVSGGNTADLPGFTWNTGNSTPDTLDMGDPQEMIYFYTSDPRRDIRMTPDEALTDAGGTIAINLNTWSGGSSGDCFNCFPYRNMNAGSLQSSGYAAPSVTIPTMSQWSLMLLALLLGLVGITRVRRQV